MVRGQVSERCVGRRDRWRQPTSWFQALIFLQMVVLSPCNQVIKESKVHLQGMCVCVCVFVCVCV